MEDYRLRNEVSKVSRRCRGRHGAEDKEAARTSGARRAVHEGG